MVLSKLFVFRPFGWKCKYFMQVPSFKTDVRVSVRTIKPSSVNINHENPTSPGQSGQMGVRTLANIIFFCFFFMELLKCRMRINRYKILSKARSVGDAISQ